MLPLVRVGTVKTLLSRLAQSEHGLLPQKRCTILNLGRDLEAGLRCLAVFTIRLSLLHEDNHGTASWPRRTAGSRKIW